MSALAASDADRYPSSDGQPMAETHAQLLAMLYVIDALTTFFKPRREDVYVGGDLLFYYEEGNPRKSVAPDAFVAFGVAYRVRDKYLLWEEPKGPDFVMEVASASTWEHDRDEKPSLYADLGVSEYWRYDPKGEFFSPRLQGLKLVAGGYEPIAARTDGDMTLYHSETLGLDLRLREDGWVRLRNPATGEDLLSHDELHAQVEALRERMRKLEAGRS